MNRLIGTVVMVLCFLSGTAQERDSVMFSAYYMAHFKLYEEAKESITEEKVLDVGTASSSFYGRWQRRREEVTDSLVAIGSPREQLIAGVMEYPTPRQFYSIYNNYPAVGTRTVTDRIVKSFHYEEPVDTIHWTLLEGDTLLMGYPCGKGICHYRGRLWTAYYTLEIPIASGPWKLNGLPGLILAAYDETGTFAFECIEIRNQRKAMMVPDFSGSIRCTAEELRAMQRASFEDPEAFVARYGVSGKGTDANGRPIIYEKKTALFLDQ